MARAKIDLLPCPRCGTVPRMEFSEELEIWWLYGKKGCSFCERESAFLAGCEESAADWNRHVENERVIHALP